MKKRSFFERLSGSNTQDDFDAFDDDVIVGEPAPRRPHTVAGPMVAAQDPETPEPETTDGEGQLPVDVYQTPGEIIVRAFIAGVRPDEVNVSISRDMIVIEGGRETRDQVAAEDYFVRELFWGSFTRTVLLPQEVDVDNSSATAKDGLLTLILPKLDKARQTKLKVRAS